MKTIEFKTTAEWQTWLAGNHDRESEIWLVYYKKATGIPTLDYQECLDVALCYGWVDSLIRRIDEQKYARKFTPRKDNSKWSLVNKTRVEQLIDEGRMTAYGMAKVEAAKRSGKWDTPTQKPSMDFEMPEQFTQALKDNPNAEAFFDSLSPTHRKQYIVWIATAKRTITKDRRIAESIHLLNAGKKLGLR